MAIVGQALTAPETGWQRFNETYSKIMYSGTWTSGTNASCYNGDYKQTNTAGSKYSFSFYGTKLRLIGIISTAYGSGHTVKIDGVSETFTEYTGGTGIWQALVYEKLGLTSGVHTVEVTLGSVYLLLDAIDIDADGFFSTAIGTALTAPESGWRRCNNSDPRFLKNGTWGNEVSNSGFYNSDEIYTTTADDSIEFNFYGTKLRIMGSIYPTRSNAIEVWIDNVLKATINQVGTLAYQILQAEIGQLSLGNHHVKIINKSNNGNYGLVFDAIDIDSTAFLCGVTGFALTTPETNWKRYNGTDSRFLKSGTWTNETTNAGFYNSDEQWTNVLNDFVKFNFYGTKVRFIASLYTNLSNAVEFWVDNVLKATINQNSALTYQILQAEVVGLTLGTHSVRIVNKTSSANTGMTFDAIDIDDTGYLAHPILPQVSRIEDMQVGYCIPARYKSATANVAGVISEIGTCTANEIPIAGTTTPDGLFYLIKCKNGLLIADRVVQMGISWDVLNTAKLIQGGAETLINTVKYRIRLISGGNSYTDASGNSSNTDQSLGAWPTNNEWDTHIVKSTLNGLITPSDNNVWHWDVTIASWIRETAKLGFISAVNTSRMIRGKYVYSGTTYGTDAKYTSWQGSSNAGVFIGFRPALEYLDTNAKATTLFY